MAGRMGGWFRVGPLGPYLPVPSSAIGWLVSLGFTGPAVVFAMRQDLLGAYMAVGLLAFLFGFGFAVAEEARRERPTPLALPYPGAALA